VDLKKIKKTKYELELEIIGENETILNPIVHTLLDNEDVEYAACMADHPLDNRRRLFIRVNKGDPNDILKKAIQHLSTEIKKLGKNFDK
jgi:DNA-directed RNA polymerase subunit L